MADEHESSETRQIATLLGGRRVFRRVLADPEAMQAALRRGFPYPAFESLLQVLEIQGQALAQLLGVASRTLARRKQAERLTPGESDRLYRVAYVLARAAETLGSLERAREWLQEPNAALGGEPPIGLLDTQVGERRVEEVLNQIDHGVVG